MIVPCGLTDTRMTSLQKLLGRTIDMTEVKSRLEAAFRLEFAEYRWIDELRGLEVGYGPELRGPESTETELNETGNQVST